MEIKLAKALLAAQKDMPGLQKNAINPHFKNKYISLDTLMESILPVLNKHGLVLMQEPTYDAPEATLTTTFILAETGESTSSEMMLCMAKNDPQGQGSAITYARRYSLMSALGLVADNDDDGEAGTAAAVSRKPARKVGVAAATARLAESHSQVVDI